MDHLQQGKTHMFYFAHPVALSSSRVIFSGPAGTRRLSVLESHETRLEAATMCYWIKRVDGEAVGVMVEIVAQAGRVIIDSTDGEPRWLLFPQVQHSDRKARRAEEAEEFATFLLSILDDVHAEIPWQHVSARALDELEPAELALVRSEVPAIFKASAAVQEALGDCMLALARLISQARERDHKVVAEAAFARRLKRQFERLPAGTILAHRLYSTSIAIVSDAPGHRTKRSLRLRGIGNQESQCDMTKAQRDAYCFLTPEKALALQPGILSAHQLLEGLRQAKELAPNYPALT
jgi:hypothetical protein